MRIRWHMRAGAWSSRRDIAAARRHWERARQIADALPAEDPNQPAMRIVPRTLLCGNAYRVHTDVGARYEELRQLCTTAGDKSSLAIGMCGLAMEHLSEGRVREASGQVSGIDGTGRIDWGRVVDGGVSMVNLIKFEAGEWSELLRWSQKVIDVTDGDPTWVTSLSDRRWRWRLATRGLARALWASGLARRLSTRR